MLKTITKLIKKLFFYFLLFTGIILSTSHLGDNYMGISDEEGYLLIVQFKENFKLHRIIQLDWETFLRYKKWHSTMNAWNISITKKLVEQAEIIFKN